MTPLLPALSQHFYLTPADVWAMCPDEIDEYLRALKKIAQEQQKARRQSRTPIRRPRSARRR